MVYGVFLTLNIVTMHHRVLFCVPAISVLVQSVFQDSSSSSGTFVCSPSFFPVNHVAHIGPKILTYMN